MRKPPLTWIFLMTLGVIWGASFLAAKLALADFGPMTIAASRLLLGALVLLTVVAIKRETYPGFQTPTDRRIWFHIFLFGVFTNALPFSLLNWGQLYVTSGFAGITMAVVPLFVLPLAHLLIPGERLTGRRTLGFGIGFIGVVILMGPATLLSSTGADLEPIARLACVAAASCYAIGSMNTRLCPPVKTLPYSAAGLCVGALIMVPMAFINEGLPDSAGLVSLGGLAFLGLFPTAAATLMLVYVINNAGPSFMSLVNYQVPVWAVIFGMIVLGEALPASFAGALSLILIGLAISQTGKKKAVTQPKGRFQV